MKLNDLAKDIHQQSKEQGWWDDTDKVWFYEQLQLVITEIAEATEGERRSLTDIHLPHRWMGEVELADVIIRLLSLTTAMGIELNEDKVESIIIDLAKSYSARGFSTPRMHLEITCWTCKIATCIPNVEYGVVPNSLTDITNLKEAFTHTLASAFATAEILNYDLDEAIGEKLNYNALRPDHKSENRNTEHGKKY